jgi:transposase-like protein
VPRDGDAVRVKLPPAGPPPEWLERAKQLYAEGRTLEQTGKACGVSGATVGKMFHRYGIATRKPFEAGRPPKQPRPVLPWLAEAVRLYAEGLSIAQVAERVGVCDRRVGDVFRKQGVPLRPRPVARLTEGQEHDAILLHKRGRGVDWIASCLKVSPWLVRKCLDFAKRHPAAPAAPDAAQGGQP